MIKDKKAAVYLVSSRKEILEKTLVNFYENWNYNFDYPVYVHYWGRVYDDDKYIEQIKNNISKNIFFKKIKVKIPESLDEKDLFYNRKYNDYVKKKFSKKRIGYLHMLRFTTNLTSYGDPGCLVNELKKYNFLMKIDDEIYIKRKINFDLIDTRYCLSTAFSHERVPLKVRKECSENLFKFYKYYLKKFNIEPKSKLLKDAIFKNDENLFLQLPLPAGNLNIYNIDCFIEKGWEKYIKELNNISGDYKYRWGDCDTIGLFAQTHFDYAIHNFDLIKKGFYLPEFPDSGPAPDSDSIYNYYSNNIFLKTIKRFYKFYLRIKNRFKIKDENY